MKKERWVVSAKRADFQAIADRFGIDPVIARLIRNRDVTGEKEIEEYLFGDLEQLHDPLLMKDMERAADLIAEKIREKKPIRIIGDYDIDGVTATYILLTGLKDLGADVDVRIPDRIADPYLQKMINIMNISLIKICHFFNCSSNFHIVFPPSHPVFLPIISHVSRI